MIIFYCDESGTYPKEKTVNLLNQSEKDRWYFLAALAVTVSQRKRIFDIALDIKNKYLVPLAPLSKLHERSPEAEIKGHELFATLKGGQPKFKLWHKLTPDTVKIMLDELLQRLNFLHGRLFVTAIDQVLLYRKMFRLAWPAPFIALTILQQRACNMLNGQQDSERFGVFVVDRGSAVEQQYEVDEFLKTRDNITAATNIQYPYDMLLLENPVVAKSGDLAQLQICDLLLYVVADAIKNDSPAGEWFAKVEPFLATKPDGEKVGAGITFFPPEAILQNWYRH